MRALTTDDFSFEDRGKQALLSGGVEPWIKSLEFFQSEGGRPTRELIGTAGDRIAIERLLWTGGPAGGGFELEKILLDEVAADGRLRAGIRFDLDDRRAAFEEAHARFLAGEAAGIGGQASMALFGAFARRDWDAMRRYLAADAVIDDRRKLRFGLQTADEWIDSLRALADLAPDVGAEQFRILAWSRHGHVTMTHSFGHWGGGGPFEIVSVIVQLTDGDRIQRLELFDLDTPPTPRSRVSRSCARVAPSRRAGETRLPRLGTRKAGCASLPRPKSEWTRISHGLFRTGFESS